MKAIPSALSLCLLLCAQAIGREDHTQLVDLRQQIAQLESNVERAEAIRSIKRLQCAYGHYAEFGLWKDLADLFAENGIGHYPVGDLGKEGIRKLFLQDVGKGKLGLPDGMLYPHIMLQPVVTLEPDGKSAKGRWRVFTMLGNYGGTASWAGGIYENEYILESGIWKIKDLHFYLQYSGRYEQTGWTIDKGAIPFHYDPARAGDPIAAGKNQSPPSENAPDIKSMSAALNTLIWRAKRLNDESAVENLQHSYGYYVDRKMWDDAADLFTADATMELGRQGVYVGKKSIRHSLNQFGPQGLREGELNDHLQLQTVIHIAPDGLSAKARGNELIMSGKHGVSGEWGEGIFENQYVKQGGIWRIQSMHVYQRLLTDYDKGWAKDAKPAPGPSKDFPPDRASTEAYEIFPGFSIPKFHFNNPVTSRPTQYGERAGTVLPLPDTAGGSRENGAAAVGSIIALQKKADEAERLLKAAVGYDAAENIASAYGYYIDDFMWDETADLFARDGWKELSYVGAYVGRERIRQSLKIRYPGSGGRSSGYFTGHQVTQPVIHVSPDGQSANVRVRLFQLGGASGGSGMWIGGIYENKAIVEDGVWKIKAMDLDYVWTADYKGGWAHAAGAFRPPPDVMSSKFPPDKPLRGVVTAPFPKIMDMPFHYVNPVSGRKPSLLLP
jgi:hypothetical protein